MTASSPRSRASLRMRSTTWAGSSGSPKKAAVGSGAVLVQGPPESLALAAELVGQFDTAEAAPQTAVQTVQLKNAEAIGSGARLDPAGQKLRLVGPAGGLLEE